MLGTWDIELQPCFMPPPTENIYAPRYNTVNLFGAMPGTFGPRTSITPRVISSIMVE